MKMIAALRNQFGGHAVTSSKGATEVGADSPGADAGGRSAAAGAAAGRARHACLTVHVSHLSLTDFRSWASAEVELGRAARRWSGSNGQGKTNLVEALGYVATLGSHRVSVDAPLVRAGAERAVVRARVERDGRSTLVELELNPARRTGHG